MKRLSAASALAFIALALCLPVKIALADGCGDVKDPTCYEPLTTIPGAFTKGQAVNPVSVITNIYGISIGIAAVLAVGMITWAGIQYATTESITGHSTAKEHWEGAIWGLVILLGSYIMLRTINVDLVNINLDLGKPNGGGLVAKNPLEDLNAAVTSSTNNLATAEKNTATIQQNAQNKAATVQATIADLQKQLAASSTTAEQAAVLQDKLTYAQTVLGFENANASRAQAAQDVSSAVKQGHDDVATAGLIGMKSAIDNEISSLKAIKTSPTDTTTQNAVTQRILDLQAQQKELDTVTVTKNKESTIYGQAVNVYSAATPSKPGLTVEQFKTELFSKTILVSSVADSMQPPATLIQTVIKGAQVSHPEAGVILNAYNTAYAQGIDTAIQARLSCYTAFLNKTTANGSCAPFGNG